MQESIVFLVGVQRRRKESSRSLSHLLMSFLFYFIVHNNLSRLPENCILLNAHLLIHRSVKTVNNIDMACGVVAWQLL